MMRNEDNNDDEHRALVNRCRNGLQIEPRAFRRYRILSYRDFGDESRWLGAPIIVFTERERFTLQHSAAVRFARVNGLAVIRWRTTCSAWHQQPIATHRETAREDPCFFEYFVENAESALYDNVNPTLGLTRGLYCRFHSLTMKTRRQEQLLERELTNASPGDIITLAHAPQCINVKVDSCCVPSNARRKLAKCPNEAGKLLISLRSSNTDPGVHTIVPGGKYYKPSVVKIHRSFPVVPNFVLTVRSAAPFAFQRIILALSERRDYKVTHEDLYLALSRVSSGDDIRLLLRGDTVSEKWKTLEYMRGLKYASSRPWSKPQPFQLDL